MKKLRKPIFSILCWSIFTILTAQPSKIDSLENVLATIKLKNQEKAVLLINLSNAYRYADTAKCKTYAIEALQLAQKAGLKLEEARAYHALGNFYTINSLPYQAHVHFIKAEKIFIELEDKERLLAIYRNLMIMFNNIKDIDNGAYYANKVLTMATETNDLELALLAQMFIGDALFQNNYGQEALDYFLNLHQKALHSKDFLGMSGDLSTVIGSRCTDIYLNMNLPHEALPYLLQRCEAYKTQGIITSLGLVYSKLANVYALLNNIDSAEYYINKAKDSNHNNYFRNQLYLASSKVDYLKGDFLSSLENFQKYHYQIDSISREEKSTEMARLRVWHEFEQKEVEKRILQQEYQKQRKLALILGISSIIIFALLALTVLFYRKINLKNRELNSKNCEIVEKNCQLEELHATKDKLFSVVAHDLRSPIASLIAVLEMTDINIINEDSQKSVFNDISKRVNRAYELLDNLLQWAKSQMHGIVPSPVNFDAQTECAVVTDLLQNAAVEKKITLINRIEKQNVYADKDMFLVVMRNLTSNAIKYTSAGGQVTIDSELSENMLALSVKDTGSGISQEIQNKLFKLSETKSQLGTDNETGTGLGLVLCADFVKANGGKIWLTSKEGEGTTFFFSVPVTNG